MLRVTTGSRLECHECHTKAYGRAFDSCRNIPVWIKVVERLTLLNYCVAKNEVQDKHTVSMELKSTACVYKVWFLQSKCFALLLQNKYNGKECHSSKVTFLSG